MNDCIDFFFAKYFEIYWNFEILFCEFWKNLNNNDYCLWSHCDVNNQTSLMFQITKLLNEQLLRRFVYFASI